MSVDVKADLDSTVMHTFGAALNRIDGDDMIATEVAIPGFFTLDDGREVQAFVKLAVFDEELLESDPDTGGLLENTR